jgi:uncharacterized protein YndB with AHSA1/START domain
MEPMATLDDGDGRPVLRFERRLAHPREKVWKAITDPAEMEHWFPASISADLKVGAPMQFSFEGHNPDVESPYDDGEILEFEPPRVYAFRWTDSVLRFELSPDGDGTRLVFTHTLGGVGTWGDRRSAARNAAGWDGCLAILAARLDGRTHTLEGTWWFERAERYIELFGLGAGEIHETGTGHRLRFERDLMQPVDTVWATLLDGATAAVGGPPPARAVHGALSAGELTKVDPPHLLEYTVTHDGAAVGAVRFELNRQEPIGCRLVVTQTLPEMPATRRASVLAAWQVRLELFFAALHGDNRSWPAERAEELETRYAALLH